MIYSGKALSVDVLPSGIANLVFDLEGSSVNKFEVCRRRAAGACVVG
jgi:hypothetical protein